jgi:hypothetical protein
MHGMRGITAVASQRAFSAGSLLIAAGGLALYQMTSLVLGPAGSRELHLSLNVSAADQDTNNESWAAGTRLSLGSLATPSPAAPVRAASTAAHRATGTPSGHPVNAPVSPVEPQPTATIPSAPPLPPVVPVQDPKPAQKGDDTRSGGHKGDVTKPGGHKGGDAKPGERKSDNAD